MRKTIISPNYKSAWSLCYFYKVHEGGVHPGNFRKHDSEIAVDTKGPPSGPTFWSGLEAPNHRKRMWLSPICLPKVA